MLLNYHNLLYPNIYLGNKNAIFIRKGKMELYKIYRVREENGFFGHYNHIMEKYWVLEPPEETTIVNIGEEKIDNNKYAITYHTKDMNTKKLMKIMFSKLSVEEVKTICDNDKWIASLYLNYLKNPLNDKDFKKKIKETIDSADNASCMSTLSLLLNVMN